MFSIVSKRWTHSVSNRTAVVFPLAWTVRSWPAISHSCSQFLLRVEDLSFPEPVSGTVHSRRSCSRWDWKYCAFLASQALQDSLMHDSPALTPDFLCHSLYEVLGTAKPEDIADPSEASWNIQTAITTPKALAPSPLALTGENRTSGDKGCPLGTWKRWETEEASSRESCLSFLM